MNTVAKILDVALNDCFSHHMEHTNVPVFPESQELQEVQQQFLDSLSEEQRALFKRFDDVLTSVDTWENHHYYRLGFKDGLAAWRGA